MNLEEFKMNLIEYVDKTDLREDAKITMKKILRGTHRPTTNPKFHDVGTDLALSYYNEGIIDYTQYSNIYFYLEKYFGA